jgi:MFS family permease
MSSIKKQGIIRMTLPAKAVEVEPRTPGISPRTAWLAVAVAALGYFVDVFDMWLFANFRIASLTALGLTPAQVTDTGAFLINCQQVGFLVGGFVWGIMGDKRGRVSVMFGSILLYSAATLLSGFVTTIPEYAVLRFITGFGLAGEIGAGITLVSEILPSNKRGYGTTIVATLGVGGAIGAAYVGKVMQWQNAYILGGILGFLLLGLRLAVYESGLYSSMSANKDISRGSLRLLFNTWERASLFLSCICIGIPIYLVFGLYITFSPEIAASLGIQGKVSVPDVMIWGSIGMTVGDLVSGLLSQAMHSRKKPILMFMSLSFICCMLIMFGFATTPLAYCVVTAIAGFGIGCWACLITTTAEQFGTNIRATVTTLVPNLVRASAIPLNLAFVELKAVGSPVSAALWLTLVYFGLSFLGLMRVKETYGRDLDYFEVRK